MSGRIGYYFREIAAFSCALCLGLAIAFVGVSGIYSIGGAVKDAYLPKQTTVVHHYGEKPRYNLGDGILAPEPQGNQGGLNSSLQEKFGYDDWQAGTSPGTYQRSPGLSAAQCSVLAAMTEKPVRFEGIITADGDAQLTSCGLAPQKLTKHRKAKKSAKRRHHRVADSKPGSYFPHF